MIQVAGKSYDCGFQHGEQARDRVSKSIEIYRDAFQKSAGLEWSGALDRARQFTSLIRSSDPEILNEMQGIADGSGFQLEEIVAINCRTEILFGAKVKTPSSEAHECTTIAVTPNASAGGKTILAKNWDWREACRQSVIILQVEQDEGPDFVMVVEAGMVGRDGFNEEGIAVCGNLLRSTSDGSKAGVPVPFIRRRALNSRRLDEAIGAIVGADRAASTNYIIAHESGVVIDFEASPERVYTVYPESGLLTHSNHFTAVAAQVAGIDAYGGWDTLYRHQRVRDLLEPKLGAITIEDIKAALRDHAGYPKSVCRHPDDDAAGHHRSASIASVIMDLDERVMYVASGPPCSNEYRMVHLAGAERKEGEHARRSKLAAD
jgi:isopenicillin-N N-acyltransferase-like protein